MLEETHYNINVIDPNKRRKLIKERLNRTITHRETFYIKGRWRQCPIIFLDLGMPIYHLNNGRTRSAQKSYIIEKGHRDNFFLKSLENNQQQKIQHKILFKMSQDPTANIYKVFKSEKKFAENSPLLVDQHGMVLNGNRRLAAVRELYKSDVKKYDALKRIPCAIVTEHLDDKAVKEIENHLQIKKENKQDYDWVSICMEVKDEKERLKLTFKQIGVNMGKTETEIERFYNLIKVIDECLEKDHKRPGDYDSIKNQEQLWRNTEEKAHKRKKMAEKDAIYKVARMISVNSGKLGDRDYKFASALQKKTNLNETINFLAKHYKIKSKEISSKNSNDPLDNLTPVGSGIDATIVHQIPVKKSSEEVIIKAFDNIVERTDQSAALTYSAVALAKVESMQSMRYPETHRTQIRKNLKDLVRKSEGIISKIKN